MPRLGKGRVAWLIVLPCIYSWECCAFWVLGPSCGVVIMLVGPGSDEAWLLGLSVRSSLPRVLTSHISRNPVSSKMRIQK